MEYVMKYVRDNDFIGVSYVTPKSTENRIYDVNKTWDTGMIILYDYKV